MSENSGDDFGFWILDSWAVIFPRTGQRVAYLSTTQQQSSSSSNRYLLDNMSYARAIDYTQQ